MNFVKKIANVGKKIFGFVNKITAVTDTIKIVKGIMDKLTKQEQDTTKNINNIKK
jgi:hypothetical protein